MPNLTAKRQAWWKSYYARNRETMRARAKAHYQARRETDPEGIRNEARERARKRRHALTGKTPVMSFIRWCELHPEAATKDAYSADQKLRTSQHSREYYQRIKDKRRAADLVSRFGITEADYARMLAEQNGVCAICGGGQRGQRRHRGRCLSVDHDHSTGRVRGLLCDNCNRALGWLGDSLPRIRKAIQYLEERA